MNHHATNMDQRFDQNAENATPKSTADGVAFPHRADMPQTTKELFKREAHSRLMNRPPMTDRDQSVNPSIRQSWL
jgi:hypothetical protein